MDRIGSQVGQYQLLELLHETGSSTFYKGVQSPIQRPVLIEVVVADGLWLADTLLNRAVQLAKLDHPAVTTLLDYQVEGTSQYFISEYADGISLQEYQHVLQMPLPPTECFALFNRILDGFAYLHKQGITHGQVHPSSIIILKDGRVKVVGLGNANWIGKNYDTKVAPLINRSAYDSPEALRGAPLNPASDVYSLGLMLREMLTGMKQPLYNPPQEELFAHYSQPVSGKAIPKEITALIDRATKESPQERLANAIAFQKTLQQFNLLSPPILHHRAAASQDDPLSKKPRQSHTAVASIEVPMLFLVLVVTVGFVIKLKQSNPAQIQYSDSREVTQQRQQTKREDSNNIDKYSMAEELLPAEDLPAVDSTKDEGNAVESLPHDNAIIKDAIREKMEDYYTSLLAKDTDKLMRFFHFPLQRFFSEQNVSAAQLRTYLNQAIRRTPEAEHNVMWNTMRIGQDKEGNYIVDYWMYYHYRRANRHRWQKQIVFTQLKLNRDLEIVAMAGH